MIVLYAYDPEMVVFGGAVSAALPFFEAALRRELARFPQPHVVEYLAIERNEHPDIALPGAAALCLEANLSTERLQRAPGSRPARRASDDRAARVDDPPVAFLRHCGSAGHGPRAGPARRTPRPRRVHRGEHHRSLRRGIRARRRRASTTRRWIRPRRRRPIRDRRGPSPRPCRQRVHAGVLPSSMTTVGLLPSAPVMTMFQG